MPPQIAYYRITDQLKKMNNRQLIGVTTQAFASLGKAWAYLMTPEQDVSLQ